MCKTKELIVDYRKRRAEQAPININGAVVEWVESFKFIGFHITNQLSWSKHTKSVVKRARKHIFPLRRLKRFGMGPQILKRFYSGTIESLVWQLLGIQPYGASEGSVYDPVHHGDQASCLPGTMYKKNCQRL